MKRTRTVIIGAGQAGLAMSRILTDRGHDHVLLERGHVAQRWSERWDSLRLLTPNWMSRLPGWSYHGPHPDGFMRRDGVIDYLRAYAASFDAPVQDRTTVLSVASRDGGWRVVTDRDVWQSESVVVATGYCDRPHVPAIAEEAPLDLYQLASSGYRNPRQLPAGGVLVVGASSSGVQLADELRRSGRQVVLAVGRHTRLPRRYRGKDILYWLDRLGSLDRPLSSMPSVEEARREPSLQLVGRRDSENLDLAVLHSRGVRLAGHLLGFDRHRARFAQDLRHSVAKADLQLGKILDRIDRHIAAHGLQSHLPPADRLAPVPTKSAPRAIDLRQEGIGTVLWATGYRRSYPWLHAPVLDRRGEILHERGRTPAAGLYVLGLQFMIRRRSSLIDGVGRDAREIADHITASRATAREEAA